MKHLVILLCLALALAGCTGGKHMTGTGTVGDPYMITTRADLEAVNNDLTAYYELGADIDLSGADWTPIALDAANTDTSATVLFTGSFDGKHHRISGMVVRTPATDEWYNYGLFSVAGGVIKDVAVCGAKIFARSATGNGRSMNVGIICGLALNGLSVTGCTASGTVSKDGDGFVNGIGGIVGFWYNETNMTQTISNCRASLTIEATNETDASSGLQSVGSIGGEIGNEYSAELGGGIINIKDCIGSLVATSVHVLGYAGGLLGWTYSWGVVNISGCMATVDIETSFADYDHSWNLGGFAGFLQSYSHVSDCKASGKIHGGYDLGGFAGLVQSYYETVIERCGADTDIKGFDECMGGFVGENDKGYGAGATISYVDCYALGSVEATIGDHPALIGGFAGSSSYISYANCYSAGQVIANGTNPEFIGGFDGGTVNNSATNCFWDTQTSGQSVGYDGVGKTTAEMQTQSTFTNWNFSTVWNITSGLYPFLRTAFVTITDGCAVIVHSFPWVGKFQLSRVP